MELFRSFRQRPLRGSLLLLQVLFGTLLMTLALSAALNSRKDTVAPERFNVVAGYETDAESRMYEIFNARDLPEILDLAPAVENIAAVSDLYEPTVVVGNTRYELRSGARVGAAFFRIDPLEIVRGDAFTQAEALGKENVALLSENAAQALFGDADPSGQNLNLETDDYNNATAPAPPTPYRIVGTFRPATTDRFGQSPPLYIPYGSAGDVNSASLLSVRAKEGQGEAARTQLLSALRQVYEKELERQGATEGQDFMIRVPGEEMFGPEGVDQDLLTFGLFGAVALIVSAIGIFSATLVETEERSHEIGVRRALGASAARIGLSLIGRALATALVGGLIGVLGAALLIPLLQEPAQNVALFGGERLAFEPLAALIALGLVALISGVLGLIPAFRVGRLKPVQALRESP